jgi:glycine betaine/proline transport system permease protein
MDSSAKWLSDHRIPFGKWGEQGFDFVTHHFEGFFDFVSMIITTTIDGLVSFLLWLPFLAVMLAMAGAAYALKRSWRLAMGVCIGLILIANQGLWVETMQTLALVLTATAAAMALGVSIGIFLGHRPSLFALFAPVLDLMQTLPTFVYLIPTLVLFGLGVAPGLVATIVFAAPTVIRLTYIGISRVPTNLLEAGQAFGGSKSQVLWKIELPSAAPVIMESLTQCIMLSLSMVVVAALVGADGLGKPVVLALSSVNVPLGLEAGLSIVILAIILDRTLKIATKKD